MTTRVWDELPGKPEAIRRRLAVLDRQMDGLVDTVAVAEIVRTAELIQRHEQILAFTELYRSIGTVVH